MKEQLQKCDAELLEINRRIMELKTELVILEGRKEGLYQKRNNLVGELQYRLNQLDKENRK